MKISCLHPTMRTKPGQQFYWADTMRAWFERCDEPLEVQYCVCIHEFRFGITASMPDWGSISVIVNRGRDVLVDQANTIMPAGFCDIHVPIDDDLFPPEHWDTLIREAIQDTSVPVVLQCSNCSTRKDIFVPAIRTRALVQLIGPCSPEYEHMFVDDEWAVKARRYGTVIERPDIVFEHKHPVFGTARWDEAYLQANSRTQYAKGKEVFDRRQAAGFPRVTGIPGWEDSIADR